MADKIWDDKYEKGVLKREYGKGKLFNELNLEEVFSSIGLTKDVELNTSDTVIWTHCSLPGMEIYFVANQMSKTIDVAPSFRVKGLEAQLWNVSTGEVLSIDDTPSQDVRSMVKLRMHPAQSWFVVFTNMKSDTLNKANLFVEKKTLLSLDKAWTVQFIDTTQLPISSIQMEKLCDWSASENPMIRYYSGTAVYKQKFVLEEMPAGSIQINLGEVHDLAEVWLNGKLLGGTWINPHVLTIGSQLVKGENTIEIKVVNRWRNRLIYEKNINKGEKKFWWLYDTIASDEKTISSGLIGPVVIEVIP